MATVLGIFFIIVCVLLVLLVLIQKGRGGGLGAALGGFGSSAFGTKTGDMATVVTIVLAAIYLLIGVLATYAFSPDVKQLGLPVLKVAGQVTTQDTIQVAQDTKITVESQTRGVTVRYAWDQQDVEDFEPAVPPEGLLVKFEPKQGRRTMSLRAFREGFPSSEVRTITFVRELEPAPRPEIEPASKPISDPLEVTIIAGSDDVTTHYTLDGSQPSRESSLYEGPFTVQPGTTVKAVSFLEDHKPSVTVTETYSIQGAPEEDDSDEGSTETDPGADSGSDAAPDPDADSGNADSGEADE